MANERLVERRRIFQQYKEDVKERGKPFFPYAMWHDTIMSFIVVVVIIGLAIVWKYSTPGNHHTIEAGWLGKLYDAPADPGTDVPAEASIRWPNRTRVLTRRLRQSEYDAIQRAAERRHRPASTLARSLLLDKLDEHHAS